MFSNFRLLTQRRLWTVMEGYRVLLAHFKAILSYIGSTCGISHYHNNIKDYFGSQKSIMLYYVMYNTFCYISIDCSMIYICFLSFVYYIRHSLLRHCSFFVLYLHHQQNHQPWIQCDCSKVKFYETPFFTRSIQKSFVCTSIYTDLHDLSSSYRRDYN